MNHPLIASRIFNSPLMMHPRKLDAIVAGLGPRILGQSLRMDEVDAEMVDMFSTRRAARAENEIGDYLVHAGGVAQVNVMGVLAHRTRMDASSSMVLGYESVARRVRAAAADDRVTSIVLVMDSPGGEVSGAFDLAEVVREVSESKPVTAVVDSMAASAGYLIPSGAREIVTTSTGYTGSIGVVMRHADFSSALKGDGIEITHIFAGDHKVDGNPYEPLPESVRKDFQDEIDGIYQMFVETVASHRGLSQDHVRNTQARTFRGAAAVDARLADRVATLDQVISELQASRPASTQVGQSARAHVSKEDISMTDSKQAGAEQQPATYTAADVERARTEGQASGYESGMKAEQERVSGILAHADSEGRNASMAHTCIQQGLSVDQSKALMDAVPKAAELREAPGLSSAPGHDLGPDDPAMDAERGAQSMWDQAISAIRN